MSVLLGFTGKVGSGKSAACEQLHKVADARSAQHIEFSDNVIKLGNDWMRRIGLVDRIDKDELDHLRGSVRDLFGHSLPKRTVGKFNTPSLGEYLVARELLPQRSRTITLETKDIHRPLLQWLGHEFATQVDKNFWNNTIERDLSIGRKSGIELITVGGLRYPANADLVHRQQGQVVEVVRPGHRNMAQGHAAEMGLPAECIDMRVVNDGTLHDLGRTMLNLWEDARNE